MSIIKSALNVRSEEFRANAAAMRTLVDDLRDKVAQVARGGSEEARARHLARGKLLARDRVNALLDPGSPFLELSQLAAFGMYGGDVPAAGIVAGIGRVSGQECVIVANDATVKGGTYYPITVKKHLRAQEIAEENRLPCIYLVDSGGAFLPLQDEVFPDRDHFGRIFFNQAQHVGERHPADRGRHGLVHSRRSLCAGHVGRDHHRRKPGHDFSGRPAAGEGGDRRGGERRGPRRGRRAYAALRRRRPLRRERQPRALPRPSVVANLNRQKPMPVKAAAPEDPLYDPAELYGVIPADTRKPYDVREVIARIVDGSRFDEFKPRYGDTLVTGFSHINGYPVGIVANNGILFSESAQKGAHFIELCAQRGIPLVFLQNITGFMVGRKYENRGIAKDGAKMVTAVACASVPKFTVIIGGSFGAGQLRHVRAGLQPALPVDVAERPHLGDGRRAGGKRAGDGPARRSARAGRRIGPRRPRRRSRLRSANNMKRRDILTTPPPACGTTASSTRSTCAGCWRSALGRAQRADRADALRGVPDVGSLLKRCGAMRLKSRHGATAPQHPSPRCAALQLCGERRSVPLDAVCAQEERCSRKS